MIHNKNLLNCQSFKKGVKFFGSLGSGLILLILIFSCSIEPSIDFTFDDPWFDNISEACSWVSNNIDYKKDHFDDWKLPGSTLNDGYGDCDDMAILLMGIIKYQRGYDSELLIIKKNNNFHAIVKYGGNYYNCTNGKTTNKNPYIITEKYNYEAAIWMAKYIKNY